MPAAPPQSDKRAYRRALGAFATGVCVVTADTSEGPLGITVNSFTSVSLDPPLILWCLDEASDRWPAFAAADRFAVHVLNAEGQPDSERFAWGICRLEADEYVADPDGPPLMPHAVARFVCSTADRIQMGDHMVIVGRVESFESAPGDALVFYKGRYGRAEGHGR